MVLGLFAFPLWWPLVNTPPPGETLPGLDALPPEEQPVIEQIAAEDRAFAEALIATGLMGPAPVPEDEQAMPQMQGATVYATGTFTQVDAVRRARGTVTVYQEIDGSWVIRFEEFEVRNGPQLHVFLSAHPEPRTPEEVRVEGLGFDWGPLKGTVGDQHYRLPPEFDMGAVQSVVIFSLPFQEVFSSAELIRQ